MFESLPWWSYLIIIPVMLWLGISMLIILMLNYVVRSELVPASDSNTTTYLNRAYRERYVDSGWLENIGFVPECAYQAENMIGVNSILVWCIPGEATYLSLFFQADGKAATYIVTQFAEFMIKTVDRADEQTLPCPPNLKLQTFTVNNVVQLWEHHRLAVERTKTDKRIEPIRPTETFAEIVKRGIHEQYEFVRKIPFWWLRLPAWIILRRSKYHNQPVA